jgi:energy-coupling factor transporter ATP-binding protein EcfA2
MHYCQQCPEPVMMRPEPPIARCPDCGATEQARQAALYVVTGASGSGKTTVFPHLVEALPEGAVFDVDWLIDPLGRMRPDQELDWENFRDAWLSVAHGVAQSGRATVLLGPFYAQQLEPLPARRWIGPIRYAVLDCSDATRRVRLEERPPWRERQIEQHIDFARYLRQHADLVVTTEHRSPSEVAAELASWVRTHLLQDGQPVGATSWGAPRPDPNT